MGVLSTLKHGVQREAPILFTLAGTLGFIASTVMAVRATPAALDKLEEFEPDEFMTDRDILVEKLKLLAPLYAPTIGMTMISTGLVVGSVQLSKYRQDAIMALYVASQGHLGNLQEKIIDEFGEKKAEKVRIAAAGPPKDQHHNPELLDDAILCWDHYSGRYFTVDSIEALREAVNNVNDILLDSSFASINDFYYEVKLDNVEYGDQLGWWLENGTIKVSLDSMLTDKNHPCVVVSFNIQPKYPSSGYRGGQ